MEAAAVVPGRAAGGAGEVRGFYRWDARPANHGCTEGAASPARVGVRLRGRIANLRALASALGRPDLEAEPERLVSRLFRRRGAGFLAELRGAFALAVYDPLRHELLLARDRMGREPLFFRQLPDGLAFSTRLAELAAPPGPAPDIDLEAVNLYLAFQYFPRLTTVFRQVRKLLPGQWLRASAAGLATGLYHDLVFGAGCEDGGETALAAELGRRLDAVYAELARDGGRLGILASGGVDSSTNAVFLGGGRHRRVALTAAFGEAGYDESADAAAVAASQGFEHRVTAVGDADLGRLAELVAAMNQPLADQAALPTFVLLSAAGAGLAGIVSGEGGDELFGPPRRWSAVERLGDEVANRWDLARDYAERIACCPGALRRELLGAALPGEEILMAPARLLAALYTESAATNRFQLLKLGQLKTWLPENVLAKDREVARACGLEVHFPLIADEVVDFVAGLNPAAHRAACAEKALLRRLTAARLPARVLGKPKHRFLVPVARWRRSFLALARELLAPGAAATGAVLAPRAVGRLLDRCARGEEGCDRPLWALVVLELWLRRPRPGPQQAPSWP